MVCFSSLHNDITDRRQGLTPFSSGSDVPIHLYSFSFNLNPEWTQALADREEILQCRLPVILCLVVETDLSADIEDTVDKFDLRSHFQFNYECVAAEWVGDRWQVTFVNKQTGSKVV